MGLEESYINFTLQKALAFLRAGDTEEVKKILIEYVEELKND